MKCFHHHDRDAVGTCADCGGGSCAGCLQHYAGSKRCAICASARYSTDLSAVLEEGRRAKRKLLIATGMAAFFFWTSYALFGNVLIALFNGYGWASVYLAMMPFVRTIGSRLSGGAISTSATGALFGTLWFWIVSGWWLALLGCLYAHLGGGIIHFGLNVRTLLGAERLAHRIPVPHGFSRSSSEDATSTALLGPSARMPTATLVNPIEVGAARRLLLPAAAALLLLGFCAVPLGLQQGNGCGRAPAGAATTPASEPPSSRPGPKRIATAPSPTPKAAVFANVLPSTATSAAPGSVADLLRRYYADLNANSFDANRYFEPKVERYITMTNTTTSAMNGYIRHTFPKQFKEHHFAFEDGSLSADGPNQYTYVEASSYYLVAKSKHLDQRYRVRIRLSPNGKLTFLQQFDRMSATSNVTAPAGAAATRALDTSSPPATKPAARPEVAPSPAPEAPAAESKAQSTTTVDCAVPYRIDNAGIKHLKVECNR